MTYTLAGDDADSFAIAPDTGQLTTRASLDYEQKSEYRTTVTATSATGKTASIAVTIRVINLDEPGTVSLTGGPPMVSAPLAATLTDPDGGVTDTSWTWERSADRTEWTTIADALASDYTPSDDDVDHHLRATAQYADAQGTGKQAISRNRRRRWPRLPVSRASSGLLATSQ